MNGLRIICVFASLVRQSVKTFHAQSHSIFGIVGISIAKLIFKPHDYYALSEACQTGGPMACSMWPTVT